MHTAKNVGEGEFKQIIVEMKGIRLSSAVCDEAAAFFLKM